MVIDLVEFSIEPVDLLCKNCQFTNLLCPLKNDQDNCASLVLIFYCSTNVWVSLYPEQCHMYKQMAFSSLSSMNKQGLKQ